MMQHKLKRKLGGLDIAKRLGDLENREINQRERLEIIRTRLEEIGKGASDCDGYTSNTEEATFIVNFLNRDNYRKLYCLRCLK